ncbi:AAA-4 family protein [[Leptolyngbya] sp. PCC 7376]|uniref:AlbA family DNA-binding domain-containing protein n=1 Tax=[Leptolyngbya] sp. PCC 7376 TaxID=111781 RepID=UPI00029F0044|nr:ATP-binding protein [[Leptolyngbya] sp. PCC 7376]AFY37348.1 AAA-4 family protein [[Leptolyngbya] sp. PCC 7376]
MSSNSEWTLEKLEELIKNQVQESLTLDYKDSRSLGSSNGKKNEISKDVSAFANSAGGTIIYGIQEENHLPKCIDEGVDPDEISKEWLEQVINSRIQRKIDNIHIYPIIISSNPDRVIYVVDIPQSSRAPHQANDKRFYKRYNFQSLPMEEYEIRDVSSREKTPRLVLSSHVENTKHLLQPHRIISHQKSIAIVDLRLNVINKSFEPASYAYVQIFGIAE